MFQAERRAGTKAPIGTGLASLRNSKEATVVAGEWNHEGEGADEVSEVVPGTQDTQCPEGGPQDLVFYLEMGSQWEFSNEVQAKFGWSAKKEQYSREGWGEKDKFYI